MIAIAVHGGAGNVEPTLLKERREGVQKALEEGWEILTHGGAALDAVEAAVRVMETLPFFNAGMGSVLNQDGMVEMDAGIMDGRDLNVGAVAAVGHIRHPISLARRVLESEFVILAGAGAESFAWEHGFRHVSNRDLVTKPRLEAWLNNAGFSPKPPGSPWGDTVGAVALDSSGNLAAATSTGGLTGKRAGRVGDSPLPGCGFWADNGWGAVSTTGIGEAIARTLLARRTVEGLERGLSPEEAAAQALAYLKKKTGRWAGLILVTADGEAIASFNSLSMSYAIMKDGWRTPKFSDRG